VSFYNTNLNKIFNKSIKEAKRERRSEINKKTTTGSGGRRWQNHHELFIRLP